MKSEQNPFVTYITSAFEQAGRHDKAEEYKQLRNEYDRLNEQTALVERIKFLTPDRFLEQMREATAVSEGFYKNKAGEYIHMCGIEVYGNTADLCRMGYNGEDRGVFPHWVFVDDHSISRIESPVIGFTKYFSSRCVDERHRMYPTTKEDFEGHIRKLIGKFLTPWQDPDNISSEEYIKWMEDWIAYQQKSSALEKEAMSLLAQKQMEHHALEDCASD